MIKEKDYVTLELSDYLSGEQYEKLRGCTVDRRSHWNRERKINTYYVLVSKVPIAETILGRSIAVKEEYVDNIQTQVGERRKDTVRLFYDVQRKIVNVLHNNTHQRIPFEHIDFIWQILRTRSIIEPKPLREIIGERLGLNEAEVYGKRGIYHRHYYFPIKVLQRLQLVDQKGTGPITITQKGLSRSNWVELLSD